MGDNAQPPLPSDPPFDPASIPFTGRGFYWRPVLDEPCTYETAPLPAQAVDGHPVVCKNRACPYFGKADKVEYKAGPRAYRCEECFVWTD